MEEILIACGDVDLLRKIVGDLPQGRFKPIASKKGGGIAQKLSGRGLSAAVVYETLADGGGASLCQQLLALEPAPKVLYLSAAPPSEGPFDVAIRYPVPGVVLRNAINNLVPPPPKEEDLELWRQFYREVNALLELMPTQNYYQMLGLKDGAPHHAIVAVYDGLSMRYHPDRFQNIRDEKWGKATYEKVNELFQQITEAFAVLTDRKMRRRYDQGLAMGTIRLSDEERAGKDTGPESLEDLATSNRSKKFLRLAQSDIARQDWSSALQNLQFAQSMEDNPILAAKIAEMQEKLKS